MIFCNYHFPQRDKHNKTNEESGDKSDSIWSVIAGTAKAFGLPIEYVLWDMSYTNVIMYGATLPSYSRDKGKNDDLAKKRVSADNPANNNDIARIIQRMNSIQ